MFVLKGHCVSLIMHTEGGRLLGAWGEGDWGDSPLPIAEGLLLLPIRYFGGFTTPSSASPVSSVIQAGSKHRFSEVYCQRIQRWRCFR